MDKFTSRNTPTIAAMAHAGKPRGGSAIGSSCTSADGTIPVPVARRGRSAAPSSEGSAILICVRHDSVMFMCEMCVVHVWDMTHSCVKRDMFICATWHGAVQWLVWFWSVWDMTHSCVRHDTFMCEVRHGCTAPSNGSSAILTWLMTHSRVRHDSLICETWRGNIQWRQTNLDISYVIKCDKYIFMYIYKIYIYICVYLYR